MTDLYNERLLLSEHVENTFKEYIDHKLYINDFATGGGKTRAIAKLSCIFYPQYFDKIVILCCQNQLSWVMYNTIKNFVLSDESLISSDDVLVVENNDAVLEKISKSAYKELELLCKEFENAKNKIEKKFNKGRKNQKKAVNELNSKLHNLKDIITDLKKSTVDGKLDESKFSFARVNYKERPEYILRAAVKKFIRTYIHFKEFEGDSMVIRQKILGEFPHLEKCYPQVRIADYKIVIMTYAKAVRGIDPILSGNISLENWARKMKDKKTVFFFDESDKGYSQILDTLADMCTKPGEFLNSPYDNMLWLKSISTAKKSIEDSYYEGGFVSSLRAVEKRISTIWNNALDNKDLFRDIFPSEDETLDLYRSGTFFCGPAFRINIKSKSDDTLPFLYRTKGENHLILSHAKNIDILCSTKHLYKDKIMPESEFLSLAERSLKMYLHLFKRIVFKRLDSSVVDFKKKVRDTFGQGEVDNVNSDFISLPTIEAESYTFFCRLASNEDETLFWRNNLLAYIFNSHYKKDDKGIKIPDYSVYSQGVSYYEENLNKADLCHKIKIKGSRLPVTPERTLLELMDKENNTVVLVSATSNSKSLVSNFDLSYIERSLGRKMVQKLTREQSLRFDSLMDSLYPDKHGIKVTDIKAYDLDDIYSSPAKWAIPDELYRMFSNEAQERGLVSKWFIATRHHLLQRYQNEDNPEKRASYEFYRLFEFIAVYYYFASHSDIHSMLYFKNRSGSKKGVDDDDEYQYNIIACLIDGEINENMERSLNNDGLPSKDFCKSEHLYTTGDYKEVKANVLKKLSEDKNARILLYTAYGSFQVGINFQYRAPDGLEYLIGKSWDADDARHEKDFDAIYLQAPTNYISINPTQTREEYEKQLLECMYDFMKLNEKGLLSVYEVERLIWDALNSKLMFSDKNNLGVAKNKAFWAKDILQQAIGRICRTKNKPSITHILYDSKIEKYFMWKTCGKSLTKEYRALEKFVNEKNSFSSGVNSDINDGEVLCNHSNNINRRLARNRKIALTFTNGEIDSEKGYEGEIGEYLQDTVIPAQLLNQKYKNLIVCKTTIDDYSNLDESHIRQFAEETYQIRERNEKNGYSYFFNPLTKKFVTPSDMNAVKGQFNMDSTRLSIFKKNPFIHSYFEKWGVDMEWKGKYIIGPENWSSYMGELGEMAFLAIVFGYGLLDDESLIRHLEGYDYELADFIILDKNDNYRLAIDVKNRNPNCCLDGLYDIPTSKKRKHKEHRLKCPLITVNILPEMIVGAEPNVKEVIGLIDSNGNPLQTNQERLKQIIDISLGNN